jgi:biotin carboxylase
MPWRPEPKHTPLSAPIARLPRTLIQMSVPSFVFVESNSTGTGALFATRARARGLDPVLLVRDAARYPYVAALGLRVITVDTSNPDQVANTVERLRSESGVAGIASSSEYFIETAAVLARDFGLPAPDSRAIARCRHKPTQRRLLQQAGIAVPRFAPVHSPADACAAAAALTLPVVVKPSAGSGSVGVRLCRTIDDVCAHASALCAARVNERGLPVASDLLVEEYVAADEYSVETFGRTVLGITRKHVSPEPYFVECGHDFPWNPEQAAEAIARITLDALAAVGLDWGPAHTELRLRADGPVIIEINPRLAGGWIPELVRLSTGVDLITATVALACGEPVALTRTWDRRASIRCLTAPASGSIDGVDGIEEARALPGIEDVRVYRTPPFDHVISHDFRDRIGHVIAAGERDDDVPGLAERALANLHVRMGVPQR